MVKGLDIFRTYIRDYADSYVIIGGTACDAYISSAGFTPRATKDIDIILVIETIKLDFIKQIWQFINDGNYENLEKSSGNRQYYRFYNPANDEFPFQIEIFSRIPDGLDLDEGVRITPIPADEDISSLSAILMDEIYYSYTLRNITRIEDLPYANTETLICLKAKAFSDLLKRRENGEKIDEKKIRKHKGDVFRLLSIINPENIYDIPDILKADLQSFVAIVKNDLPGDALFKEMGVPNADARTLLNQLMKNFNL